MKLYVVKYCANEFDDLGYDSPYPIYYSLDEHKARNFFEEKREQEIENFNDYMNRHPELQNNEDYCIETNTNDEFEYNFGKWFYKYMFEETEFDVDLRYRLT
jgi:hypothetical protein